MAAKDQETLVAETVTVETQDTEAATTTAVSDSKVIAKRSAPDDEEGETTNDTKKRKVAPVGSGSLLSFFKPTATGSDPGKLSSDPGNVSNTDAISDLERRTMGKDWRDALQPEFSKAYFQKLRTFVQTEFKSQTIYPVAKDVYSWSRLTPLHSVKVVVIGQDPYHGPNQAHGLSFSVKPPVVPPPSLKNIYKQIKTDFPDFTIPKEGDLTAIARQGVLWLNTSLTVRKGQAGSHSKKGWETFTAAVLKAVLNRPNSKGVVFLAWGAHAQKVCKDININTKKHLVLQSAHPSPLSAHNGFFGNGHFKKTNEWLEKTYGEGGEIDWSVLCPKEEGESSKAGSSKSQ